MKLVRLTSTPCTINRASLCTGYGSNDGVYTCNPRVLRITKTSSNTENLYTPLDLETLESLFARQTSELRDQGTNLPKLNLDSFHFSSAKENRQLRQNPQRPLKITTERTKPPPYCAKIHDSYLELSIKQTAKKQSRTRSDGSTKRKHRRKQSSETNNAEVLRIGMEQNYITL